MSTKHDLTTAEGVLEWARYGTQDIVSVGYGIGRVRAADTETAAYIADAVKYYQQLAVSGGFQTGGEKTKRAWERIRENERLRQAFDAEDVSATGYGASLLYRLRDAMLKGSEK